MRGALDQLFHGSKDGLSRKVEEPLREQPDDDGQDSATYQRDTRAETHFKHRRRIRSLAQPKRSRT
ncbi:MAG: hypothetical protein OXC19_06270 [Bryobacterales bacterium]|nr:hypothetical protein [Bryobacterales bacterium]